jgi:hypothetical protein
MKVIVRKVRLNSFLQASGDPKIKNMKYYPGAKTVIMAPLDPRNGEFPLTGLTEKDEERLEKIMAYDPGTLARTSKFWREYSVTIPEDGLELDTTVPIDELKWLVLGQSKLVAKSLQELSLNPDADFVMTNDDQEADVKNKRRETKKKAFAKLDAMTNQDRIDYLVAKGTPGIDDLSNKRIQDIVETDAEENPKKFLEVINDPHYTDKLFIAKLVNTGILKIQGTRYYEAASGLTLGGNLMQVIDYLTAPKNQTVLINLTNQLESESEDKE